MKSDTYDSFLLDFVSGALPPDMALAAELHTILSAEAENKVRIWRATKDALSDEAATATDRAHLPEALEMACSSFDTVPWKRGLSGVHYAKRGKDKGQLMRLDPGQSAPQHNHSAIEATVVLKGEFDDGNGLYRRGDLVLGGPGITHRPSAQGQEMCICFVARERTAFWRFS
ncbi:MAG: cupin domain-containing protein [Pseudomonadota bacterium]